MAEPDESRAVDLLLAEADRDRTGQVSDAATWAAVVGVERVSLVAGTQDPGRLRLLLQGHAEDDVLPEVHRARERVVDALARSAQHRSPDSGVAHRDAGHHSVTLDAVRLRAALRAAHRTFEAEPYYRERYAERGARFAGTDSAWLVTLAELPRDGCLGQVDWLSRVLAGRGMPSWLLERHLEDLVTEIEDALGAGTTGYLGAAATALRSRRRDAVSDDELLAAPARLRAGTGADEPLPGAASLVLAAAADAANGMTRGYEACVGWLTDRDRCEPAVAAWLRHEAATVAPAVSTDAGARVSAGRSRAGSRARRS